MTKEYLYLEKWLEYIQKEINRIYLGGQNDRHSLYYFIFSSKNGITLFLFHFFFKKWNSFISLKHQLC